MVVLFFPLSLLKAQDQIMYYKRTDKNIKNKTTIPSNLRKLSILGKPGQPLCRSAHLITDKTKSSINLNSLMRLMSEVPFGSRFHRNVQLASSIDNNNKI